MSHIASILGKISYNGLENNLNDSYDNEAWLWHQEAAKIRQMQGNWSLRVSKSPFYANSSEM